MSLHHSSLCEHMSHKLMHAIAALDKANQTQAQDRVPDQVHSPAVETLGAMVGRSNTANKSDTQLGQGAGAAHAVQATLAPRASKSHNDARTRAPGSPGEMLPHAADANAPAALVQAHARTAQIAAAQPFEAQCSDAHARATAPQNSAALFKFARLPDLQYSATHGDVEQPRTAHAPAVLLAPANASVAAACSCAKSCCAARDYAHFRCAAGASACECHPAWRCTEPSHAGGGDKNASRVVGACTYACCTAARCTSACHATCSGEYARIA